jgi:hypothetical protein
MKKILFLLIIGSFTLSGCKFINEKILKKGEDTLDMYIYNLEQKVANQDAELQASLSQLQRESQARIDSIIRYYENELTSRGGKVSAAATGTFYLIVGSFKTPAYATDWSAKVAGMGYKTQIIQMGYWNLVAAESYTSLRPALEGLEIVRSNVSLDSWIYVPR